MGNLITLRIKKRMSDVYCCSRIVKNEILPGDNNGNKICLTFQVFNVLEVDKTKAGDEYSLDEQVDHSPMVMIEPKGSIMDQTSEME